MPDSNPAVTFRDDLARCRSIIGPVVKARRLNEARVAPAIQDDAGDVSTSIEPGACEHPRHLLPYQALVRCVARFEQSLAAAGELFLERQSERVQPHIK